MAKERKVKEKRMATTAIGRFFTNSRSNRSVGGSVTMLVFLFLFALVSLFPVIYMANNAFKPINELYIFPPKLFVMQPTLDNFSDLFEMLSNSLVPFMRYAFNTVFIVLLGSVGHILLSSMAAFPLAKFRIPGGKTINQIVVLSLMFSPAVTAVPNYVIMSYMGLIDTYWSIILPSFALSLGLFLMKNFMEQVPDSLIDAASIDGASYFRTLFSIVMPVVRPAWITLFIVSFQNLWVATGGSFIYSESIKPLSAMLNQIAAGGLNQIAASGAGVARAGVIAATSLLMFLIPVIIYIFAQSNVLETMATSGIKD